MLNNFKGLKSIKNAVWALGIFAALGAVVIGLIITMVCKFYGTKQDGTLYLGDRVISSQHKEKKTADNSPSGMEEPGEMNKTQDQGLEHVMAMTFLCDRSISGLSGYSTGTGSLQLWTDDGSGLPVVGAANSNIVYPGDGSLISPVNAAMVSRPKWLVIYLGGDDSADTARDTFIQSYESLISQIRSASPDTVIICCSVASVSSSYADDGGMTSVGIGKINSWIATVCSDMGVYYADLASVLNDGSGFLRTEYDAGDGRTLNYEGTKKITEYFRYHGTN